MHGRNCTARENEPEARTTTAERERRRAQTPERRASAPRGGGRGGEGSHRDGARGVRAGGFPERLSGHRADSRREIARRGLRARGARVQARRGRVPNSVSSESSLASSEPGARASSLGPHPRVMRRSFDSMFGGSPRNAPRTRWRSPRRPPLSRPDPLIANLHFPDKFYIVAAFCDYPPPRGRQPDQRGHCAPPVRPPRAGHEGSVPGPAPVVAVRDAGPAQLGRVEGARGHARDRGHGAVLPHRGGG